MIGVGVIGYGYWGPNLARCFANADGCDLVGIADQSSRSLLRASKQHPTAMLFTDWRDLVKNPKTDAVVVATPVCTHFDIAMTVLRARKHVLIEKPMAASAAEGATIVEEAARRKVVLMVDHTFVYTPAVQKIRELVKDGSLGKIFYYDATRINLGLFQRDVNVIWDLAVHDLAILEYVLDEAPLAISANGVSHVRGNPENMAHITMYFAGGAIAQVNVNWLAPVKIRSTLIGGSKRMILYDDLNSSEKIKVYDRGVNVSADPEQIRNMRISYRLGDMWSPCLSTKEALLTAAEHFIACIISGLNPMTDGSVGLSVVRSLESATCSLSQRGHPIELSELQRAS